VDNQCTARHEPCKDCWKDAERALEAGWKARRLRPKGHLAGAANLVAFPFELIAHADGIVSTHSDPRTRELT
jgi:hypothetical protein